MDLGVFGWLTLWGRFDNRHSPIVTSTQYQYIHNSSLKVNIFNIAVTKTFFATCGISHCNGGKGDSGGVDGGSGGNI